MVGHLMRFVVAELLLLLDIHWRVIVTIIMMFVKLFKLRRSFSYIILIMG